MRISCIRFYTKFKRCTKHRSPARLRIILHSANNLLSIQSIFPFSSRVVLLTDDRDGIADSVERLMGTKAEARFACSSDKAEFAARICWTFRFW